MRRVPSWAKHRKPRRMRRALAHLAVLDVLCELTGLGTLRFDPTSANLSVEDGSGCGHVERRRSGGILSSRRGLPLRDERVHLGFVVIGTLGLLLGLHEQPRLVGVLGPLVTIPGLVLRRPRFGSSGPQVVDALLLTSAFVGLLFRLARSRTSGGCLRTLDFSARRRGPLRRQGLVVEAFVPP